jgi:hypothetical protein
MRGNMATRIQKILTQQLKPGIIEWDFEEPSGKRRKIEIATVALPIAMVALNEAGKKFDQVARQHGEAFLSFPIIPTEIGVGMTGEFVPVLYLSILGSVQVPFALPGAWQKMPPKEGMN